MLFNVKSDSTVVAVMLQKGYDPPSCCMEGEGGCNAQCCKTMKIQCLREKFACTGKPSAGRLGKFLVQSQFQGSVHSSALFLTAAAQNLLCMKLAAELGVNIPSPWVTWFKGAAVPALLGLLITPLIMYKVRMPLHPSLYPSLSI
jgi:di/tricarboxylate transporter